MLSVSNQKNCLEIQTAKQVVQPVSSAQRFIFPPCLSASKTNGRGPCLWHREEGNVHSNILSGADTFSVSLTSISPSCWIWGWSGVGVGGTATLISDVLLVLSTRQGHLANYWDEIHILSVLERMRWKKTKYILKNALCTFPQKLCCNFSFVMIQCLLYVQAWND